MACDERVMRNMKKKEAKNYIFTMIKMATEEKSLFATTTGFGGKNAGRKRILQALNKKRSGMGWGAAATFLGGCLLLAFVSFSQPEGSDSARKDDKSEIQFAKAVENEEVPELVEPRYEEVRHLEYFDENFDYYGVMQDIIDNYDPMTEYLTAEQSKAITIQSSIYLAEMYAEWQAEGRELKPDEIWLIDEFYGTYPVD